jgi:hypothetical protein
MKLVCHSITIVNSCSSLLVDESPEMQATLRRIRADLDATEMDWESLHNDKAQVPPPNEDENNEDEHDEDLLAEIRAEISAFHPRPL